MTKIDLSITSSRYMDFAEQAHGDQTYGSSTPYVFHLIEVCDILHDFGFTSDKFQASGALHDTLEDTETLLETLYKEFGDEVGNIVWACTGVGKNRKDRVANILEKLSRNPDACIVKCADRIANCEAGGKLEMYQKEQEAFAEVVKPHVPEAMWGRLEKALNVQNEQITPTNI